MFLVNSVKDVTPPNTPSASLNVWITYKYSYFGSTYVII